MLFALRSKIFVYTSGIKVAKILIFYLNIAISFFLILDKINNLD